jgi:hypothetical protein
MNEDEKYYQRVADDLRATGPIEGLWLKALTMANADQENAKVLYVKWRVEQLRQEEREQLQKTQMEAWRANYQPPKHSMHWYFALFLGIMLAIGFLIFAVIRWVSFPPN